MSTDCYLISTGSFLPGHPVSNENIELHLGKIVGEDLVKTKILEANGIKSRYYSRNASGKEVFDLYALAYNAFLNCISNFAECIAEPLKERISYLSAGSTYTPLAAPGITSILHGKLSNFTEKSKFISKQFEISSHAGICSSGAAAIVSAYRSIRAGDHELAMALGAENSSNILHSDTITPVDDRNLHPNNLFRSKWFMSVFLRFMLSDGAGAFLLSNKLISNSYNLKIDWTFSRSFADETSLCMKLDASSRLLTQDLKILNTTLHKTSKIAIYEALEKFNERIDNYTYVLPHISSFIFLEKFTKVIKQNLGNPDKMPIIWTNLREYGNTGSASIFIMLDNFLKTTKLKKGDRLLLFVPESGQFNFVILSLSVAN